MARELKITENEKWWVLFVRGENLLARRYEINRGFPMPRATVSGGADLHF